MILTLVRIINHFITPFLHKNYCRYTNKYWLLLTVSQFSSNFQTVIIMYSNIPVFSEDSIDCKASTVSKVDKILLFQCLCDMNIKSKYCCCGII